MDARAAGQSAASHAPAAVSAAQPAARPAQAMHAGFLGEELGHLPIEERFAIERASWRSVRSRWYLLPMLIVPTLAGALGFFGGMWLYGSRFNPMIPGQILAGAGALAGLAGGLVLFGVVYRLVVRRQVWALAPHLCSGCGYNLTANASGICPECGRPRGREAAEAVR